jgi:hypothetical protein
MRDKAPKDAFQICSAASVAIQLLPTHQLEAAIGDTSASPFLLPSMLH